jgi:hypothetical protein
MSLAPTRADATPLVPAPGPRAVYFAGDRAEAVSAGDTTRWIASGRVRVLADGRLERFGARLEAHRPSALRGGFPAPASRRADLLSTRTGERVWRSVFEAPAAWPSGDAWRSDELAVLQWTADRIEAVWFRDGRDATGQGGRRVDPVSISTEVGPSLDASASAVRWLLEHAPGLVDRVDSATPCDQSVRGSLALEGPGGRVGRWLVLQGAGWCTERVSLLALGRGTPGLEALSSEDRRAGPGAILVLAPRLSDARVSAATADRLLLLGDGCVGRTLTLEQGDTRTALGETTSLTGLRWLEGDDDPWTRWWTWVFRPANTPCGLGAARVETPRGTLDGDLAEWPMERLEAGGRLCALQESGGRAWSGPEDLSAALLLSAGAERTRVAVRVVDQGGPAPGDRVRLRLPSALVEVDARGRVTVLEGKLRDVRGAAARTPEGYTLEVELPSSALGPDAGLAALVVDADVEDRPGQALGLWIAGEPDADGDATPLPARRP